MLREKLYELKNWRGVIHTTWNPGGPGVVRIHMVPPKFSWFHMAPAIVIINGQDYIPLDESWAILLTEFIRGVNEYGEDEMDEDTFSGILADAFYRVRKVYPEVGDEQLRDDLSVITSTFEDVAYGREPMAEIGQLSIGEYAKFMTAPHRMDLIVSAMTKAGQWHCNQKCVHCYAAGQPLAETQELSTGEWKQIIRKCQTARIPQLTFTGGEPTLRKDLVELVGEARWFVTRLNTNGIRMTKELCQQLLDAELDSVQITFYSKNAEIHNKLVGGDHYNETVQGIQNALEAGLSVSINTPLCTINDDYTETLVFLHELGVRFVTCSGLIVTGNAAEEASVKTQLGSEALYRILEDAAAYCHGNEMEIGFTSPGWIAEEKLAKLGLQIPSCGACLSNMAITPDGTVVPCQSSLSEVGLGNILQDSFYKIWNSASCRQHRNFSAQMTQTCPLREKAGKNGEGTGGGSCVR